MKKLKRIILLIVILVLVILGGKFIIGKAYKKYLYITHPEKYNSYVVKYSEEFGVDPKFVDAVIKTESNFNPNAKSNVGAKGLMQITDETGSDIAEKLGISNFEPSMLYDPNISIMFGTYYLSRLIQRFNNDPTLVIAAYNAGGGNVESWLNNPEYSKNGTSLDYIPFSETRAYVQKVLKNDKIYKELYS
ncbi:MAG: lytic transglycosylase domain-containing protein [Clostridium sp.]|uniref:lytic transglycosylase domain-containing protein n=1 Tax=Clostridium sp. TaxID=1506 RepID=UPI003F340CF5